MTKRICPVCGLKVSQFAYGFGVPEGGNGWYLGQHYPVPGSDPCPASNQDVGILLRQAGSTMRGHWERGHRCYGYWVGKERRAFIGIPPRNRKGAPLRYQWSVGTHGGEVKTLRTAKAQAERTMLSLGIA